mgnify:FL=1
MGDGSGRSRPLGSGVGRVLFGRPDPDSPANIVELQNLQKFINDEALKVIATVDGSRRRLLKQQLEASHHAMKIVLDSIEAEVGRKR